MKNFTSSFALILVLVFVALYIYFVEYPSYKKKQNDKMFFTEEVIEAKILNKETGKNTTLLIKDGEWLVNNKKSEDPKTINTMLYSLKSKAEKNITNDPQQADIEKFGLNNPVMVINLKGVKNSEEQIYIGAKTAVGFGRYLWLKNKKRIVVSSELHDSFNKEIK